MTFWDDQGQIIRVAEKHKPLPIKDCGQLFNQYVEKKRAETAALRDAQGMMPSGDVALKSNAGTALCQEPFLPLQKAAPDSFLS